MRFLALTGIQSAMLAVVTAGVIVALYFLKHRRRRMVVSSTQLWKKVLENRLENSLFERLRRYVSVLIAVVTGLLVAMAIARPEIPWITGDSTRTVLILDTSPTMLARMADGRQRWEHAIEEAQSLINASSGSTEFRIADTAGAFDSPFTENRAELRRLLARMHPVTAHRVAASAHFPEIDANSENSSTKITFITDGVSGVVAPPSANVVSVFEEGANVGVTAFEVRAMPASPLRYEAFLELFNADKAARSVEITISGTGQQRIAKTVRIEGGAVYNETLDLSTFEGGGVRAAILSDRDALSLDDVAYAYLPVRRRTKVLLVTRGNKFLENALKLDRLAETTVTTPEKFEGAAPPEAYDVVVFDRYAPPTAPARPALIVGAPSAPWLRQAQGFVAKARFQTWMNAHPVLQHVSLDDVSVESAAKIDGAGLTVLAASASNTPLILLSENPKWIQLTFDVQASDFPYQSGFPIFLDNALSWFGREQLALRRSPGIVEAPLRKSVVRTVDGRDVPAQETASGVAFEAEEPGLYVASNESGRQYIAVNLSNRSHSDINRSPKARGASVRESAAPLLRREPWFYMLAAALLLIAAEWYSYHRRITL